MDQKSFIQEVLRKTDLVELVNEYLDEPMQKITPYLWKCHCPHPAHDDSTPSFEVERRKDGIDIWCCRGCHSGKKNLNAAGADKNYGCDAIAFIQFMHDTKRTGNSVSFMDAVRILAKRLGMPIPVDDKKNYFRAMNMRHSLLSFTKNLRKDEYSYLYGRGLTDDDIHKWHIGAFSFPRYGRRIVFPIVTQDGYYRGYSARYIPYPDETGYPKYINSATDKDGFFEKKRYFYGEEYLDRNCTEIRIVEGVMDVIIALQKGLRNVVATLGTALSEEHVKRILRWHMHPTVIYDGDSPGQKKTRAALDLFEKYGIQADVCVIPEGKDPAEYFLFSGADAEAYVQSHKQSHVEYLLEPIVKQYHAKRSSLQQDFLPDLIHMQKLLRTPEEKMLFKSRVKEELDLYL